jgi:NTE family protein
MYQTGSTPNDLSSGLVLSGGGARGAFQIGAWEILSTQARELADSLTVISGTSAGAINGALIASGLPPREMLEFWLKLAADPPVRVNEVLFRSLFRELGRIAVRQVRRSFRRHRRAARILFRHAPRHSLWRPSGLAAMALEYVLLARYDNISDLLEGIRTSFVIDTSGLRDRLASTIGTSEIRANRLALAINTVDVRTGRVVRFVNRAPVMRAARDDTRYHVHDAITLDMITASAAIPILFNSVQVDGIELWDGGLLVNTALAPAIALGARRIIPVLVNSGGGTPRDPMHLGDAVERLADAFLENAYNVDRKLLLLGNDLAEARPELGLADIDLFEPIRPLSSRVFDAGSYLYFGRDVLMRMYEAGKDAAQRWLARGPRRDVRGEPVDLAAAG